MPHAQVPPADLGGEGGGPKKDAAQLLGALPEFEKAYFLLARDVHSFSELLFRRPGLIDDEIRLEILARQLHLLGERDQENMRAELLKPSAPSGAGAPLGPSGV